MTWAEFIQEAVQDLCIGALAGATVYNTLSIRRKK